MSKDTRIAFRAPEELKARLQKAAGKVRLTETQLAEACVEALVEYIEEYGEITFPLAVLPKSSLAVDGHDDPLNISRGAKGVPAPGAVFAGKSNPPHTLNEEPTPHPKTTRARRALQKMQQREQKKTGDRKT